MKFTVPLCRGHHRQLHQTGNEVAWWEELTGQRARDRQGTLRANAPKICSREYTPTVGWCTVLNQLSPRLLDAPSEGRAHSIIPYGAHGRASDAGDPPQRMLLGEEQGGDADVRDCPEAADQCE